MRLQLKAFIFMLIRLTILPVISAFLLSTSFAANPTPKPSATSPSTASPTASAPTKAPPSPAPKLGGKQVVDQTAQTIIFCYHRFVEKVRYPGTEITPAAFEAQMQMLKDKGITVISLQDYLAWRRSEKAIPPRCTVISFDDGWKSQYEVAWPIMKKYGYPLTLFIYTEGVRGGLLGGGEAITWE